MKLGPCGTSPSCQCSVYKCYINETELNSNWICVASFSPLWCWLVTRSNVETELWQNYTENKFQCRQELNVKNSKQKKTARDQIFLLWGDSKTAAPWHQVCLLTKINISSRVGTHQQEKRSAENPACFEVNQHFAAPGRAVADHVNNVLAKLVYSC